MLQGMNKAVFLDRDGVINRDHGFVANLQDFEILPDVIETLQFFVKQGFILIVVSNQSGIAKGFYKKDDVELLHNFLIKELEQHQIFFSEIYYCIHHSDTGKCLCRKPGALFLEKAISRFNINPKHSYFIGDKVRDIEAAENAAVNGILIEANTSIKKVLHLIKF